MICLLHNETGDLITGDSNGTIYVWGNGGNVITNFVKHGHEVTLITFSFFFSFFFVLICAQGLFRWRHSRCPCKFSKQSPPPLIHGHRQIHWTGNGPSLPNSKVIPLCHTRQALAPNIDHYVPGIWPRPLTLTLKQGNTHSGVQTGFWHLTLTYNPNPAKVNDLHNENQSHRIKQLYTHESSDGWTDTTKCIISQLRNATCSR